MLEDQLIVTGGPGLGAVRALRGEVCVLGSEAGCELHVEAPGIAPRHVEFRREAGGPWRLRALAPVMLDGASVERAVLRPGCFLQVGSVEFSLREGTERTGPGGTLATPHPFASPEATSLRATEPARPRVLAPTPLPLPAGSIVDGRYELGEPLAAGGMGEVFHARHLELDRPVALKVMKAELSDDPEFARRFKREAMAAGRIGQQNIVDVFDLGRTADGRLYFAMEYVDGLTLAALLRRDGALPVPRAVNVLAQVARALAAAHAAGIVHRDLKPDNVMVVQRPGQADVVKVLDFGVAKVSRGAASGSETAVGSVVGTPQYMAPEQAQGLPADPRSDIYALGLLAHELLRGRPTFEAQTPSMLIVKQVTEPPERFREPLASTVPPALDALIFRMLAKAPADRPQSMPEVLAVLENRASPAPPPRAPSPRRGLRVGAPVAAALVLAGAALLLLGRSGQAPPPLAAPLPVPAPSVDVPSPTPAAPAEAPVRITFTSEPAARVGEGEVLLGVTPLELARPRGTLAEFTFRAEGHREQVLKVRFEADVRIPISLEPEAEPAKRAPSLRGLKDNPY